MTDLASRPYGFYSTAPKRVVTEGPSVDDYITWYEPKPPVSADFPTAEAGPKKPGPKPDLAKTEAVYADYCTGLSVDEVAQKWGVQPPAVYRRFAKAGLALRKRPDAAFRAKGSFELANGLRAAEAGRRNAEAAKAALGSVGDPRQQLVLELRAAHPDKSLAELGAMCHPPMSKHAFAGLLRRALTGARS